MRRQAGFTLVEIAIVLVVIGLLLGGILKGQELVLNSQIRSAINEYNNVASAMFAYQDRYRQIPGDDPNASQRWSGNLGTSHDGDGDRLIQGAYNDANATAETRLFWTHLRNDELIPGERDANTNQAAATALPRNAFDGDIGVQDATQAFSIPGVAICQDNVPGKAALIIDNRIDDGSPTGANTGSLQAGDDMSATDDYADGTRYVLCREL